MRAGTISPKAMRKYLGATSADAAAFTSNHLDAPQHQRPGPSLGAILANPKGDWGPADTASRQHIDRRANKRTDKESKYLTQRTWVDRPERASTARVKAGSAHEYYSDAWYGHPGSRQGG
jgi:hypothetical protein